METIILICTAIVIALLIANLKSNRVIISKIPHLENTVEQLVKNERDQDKWLCVESRLNKHKVMFEKSRIECEERIKLSRAKLASLLDSSTNLTN